MAPVQPAADAAAVAPSDVPPTAPAPVFYAVQSTLGGKPTYDEGDVVSSDDLFILGWDIARLVELKVLVPTTAPAAPIAEA